MSQKRRRRCSCLFLLLRCKPNTSFLWQTHRSHKTSGNCASGADSRRTNWPNDLAEWAMQENRHFLNGLNLSALTFLIFPPLGIIVPYILWSGKRNTVKDAERTGKEIINFQIIWILSIYPLFILFKSLGSGLTGFGMTAVLLSVIYNLILILVNQWRIDKGRPVRYFPKIRFLK